METKEVLKVEEIENSSNGVILDVPDYVYVSGSGKTYHPKPTKMATAKIKLEDAEAKGFKPSRAYKKFVENLYQEYLKSQKK